MTQLNMNLMEVQSNIQELQTALLDAHPEMPVLLRKIHSKLRDDPEIVTLLTEEEIAAVISGLQVQTNISLTQTKASGGAKKPSATSRLNAILGNAKISADDF